MQACRLHPPEMKMSQVVILSETLVLSLAKELSAFPCVQWLSERSLATLGIVNVQSFPSTGSGQALTE